MSDYTPSTQQVRAAYAAALRQLGETSTARYEAEFDRWLERTVGGEQVPENVPDWARFESWARVMACPRHGGRWTRIGPAVWVASFLRPAPEVTTDELLTAHRRCGVAVEHFACDPFDPEGAR